MRPRPLAIRPEITPARRILVVDDMPEVAELFRSVARRLAHRGFAVETETDPRRAIGRIRTTPYDLVVTDLRMPHADGLTVLQATRHYLPDCRRALMSGQAFTHTSPDRLAAAAPHAMLAKPFGAVDLHRVLLGILDHPTASWPAPVPWRADRASGSSLGA